MRLRICDARARETLEEGGDGVWPGIKNGGRSEGCGAKRDASCWGR
jgi:hypothetical protein